MWQPEDVEPLCWAPREQGQRKGDPKRRCYKARLRHEPREAMYGCLCLYRPQLWKATVLFTVKGCDGPPSEKGPLCPSFCVYVCVCTWVGWGWVGCIFGPNSEDLTVLQHTRPSKTCRIPLILSSVYVNNWCVNVCVATGLPTHRHAYSFTMKYEKVKILTCLLSWETYKIKQNDHQYLTEMTWRLL